MIILPNQHDKTMKEVVNHAAGQAAVFMRALFGGGQVTKCTCGMPVSYREGKLHCAACGNDLNVAGYIRQYRPDLYVRTMVDVDNKKFKLTLNDTEDFDDISEGDTLEVPEAN